MHYSPGQRVGVYGYGKTGRACVDYLLPQLATPVVLLDAASPEQQASLRSEAGGRFEFAVGPELPAVIERLDALVLSPGVPVRGNPLLARAHERGIPVLSELELAGTACPGYVIAITGTNGKSTTTKLLGHVLSALGPAHVLGNIGTPLISSLDEIRQGDYVALEVSSYQLETIDRFAPQIAIYTNLTPDHIERHGSLEEYARVKRRMVDHMAASGFVITNALCPEFSPDTFDNRRPTFLQYISSPSSPLRGAWVSNGRIHVDLGGEQHTLPLDCIKLPGVHNLENALAVILAALLCGTTEETLVQQLSTFTGYEHRIELCRSTSTLRFYNDSKATNPEATITALKALDRPLALILGGRDKLTPLADLVRWVQQRADHVVLYGEAAQRFEGELRQAGYTALTRVHDVQQALAAAVAALGPPGGNVLLSPACASFDQYTSYEERGDDFKQLVGELELS
jgi:UDP-N-acetylmuramoylalanine--D-glutamate ligase